MPFTDDEERDEERRRLLESVDYRALEGFDGATSPITGEPSRRDADERARSATSEALQSMQMPTIPPIADAPRPSSAQVMAEASGGSGQSQGYPDTPGSRRVGSMVTYPSGQLPLPPRAQEIERRLQGGERGQIDRELALRADAERDDMDAPELNAPQAPAAPQAPPQAEAQAEERALASLADEAPPVASPAAPALDAPVDELGETPKPEAVDKGPAQGLILGEDELRGAREGDVPRRLLHNLANAFRALGGRSPNREFVRDEDRVRAQQRQMLGEKQGARREEQRADAQAMSRALQERQLAQRGEQQGFQQRMAERNADRQDQLSQAQLSRLLEQTESERADRQYTAARRTPGTPESGRERVVMESLISALPDGDRTRLTNALADSSEDGGQSMMIDRLSAEELESLREDLPSFLRNGLSTRGARGARPDGTPGRTPGGNGTRATITAAITDRIAGPNATPEQRAAAEREAQALVAALGPRRAGQSLLSDHLQTGRAEDTAQRQTARQEEQAAQEAQGPELIPGSGIRAGGDIATNEDARWRDGFSGAMSNMAGLRRVDQIANRFGRTGAINPEARAAIVPELTMLRSMVARMGETGVITAAEVPTINAALPNPNDPEQATFETFSSRLAQWRSILEDNVRARTAVLGVNADGQRRIIRALRTGRVPSAEEQYISIITPDGRRGSVPESQLERALQRGARRAE